MRTRAISVRTLALAATLSMLVLVVGTVVNGPGEEVNAQSASADYFLEIEGIDGESIDEQHRGEIDVQSWSWGESNSGRPFGSAGSGAGKVSMNDFHFTMRAGKATPKLMLACAEGKIIPSATLTGRTANGQTFVRWELKNVIISSYKTAGEHVSGPPTDEIRIRFTQIFVTSMVQNADGTTSEVKAGYDLAKNKKV
jgi:type VI secretion system secreted protein Hcp